MAQKLVAGVDSSTQSCKVVIREVETGQIVRTGSAKHPDGTEVNPESWWLALNEAIANAGGLNDVAAISIGGQQHGMVVLDEHGCVIRDALLWNDTRSAAAAEELIAEFGKEFHASVTGSVPVASFTITKLRWLKNSEPENAAKVHAVALPHDWLTWRLRGFGPKDASRFGANFAELKTDRSDAAGTGYFNSVTNEYSRELLVAALGHDAILPKVVGHAEAIGEIEAGQVSDIVQISENILVGPGAGDNAGAALGLNAHPGDVIVSIGTSGTVFSVAAASTNDETGTVAGFADASGNFLPITVTLNAARILKSMADLLDVDFDGLAKLALAAKPGADGLVLLPFFEGERTPNLPNAKASLHGMSLGSTTRENLARAAIEGMLCGLEFGLEGLLKLGVKADRLLLIGGGAQNEAVQKIAATIFGLPVVVPAVSEYVAEGAAIQAAWILTGQRPNWPLNIQAEIEAQPEPAVVKNYRSYLAQI